MNEVAAKMSAEAFRAVEEVLRETLEAENREATLNSRASAQELARHVLAHVAALLAELGVVLNKLLHVCHTLNVSCHVSGGLKVIHKTLDGITNLTKVAVHVCGEEVVLLAADDHLGLVFRAVWAVLHVHPVISNADKLVYHCLRGRGERRGRKERNEGKEFN